MQEVEKIAGEVLGEKICTCPVCTAKAAGTGLDSRIELHRQQIEARICEMLNSRRERAAVVIAKLVGMRDSIVADQFFASIGDQPLWNLRSEI
jgi:hypothetical protein